MSVSKIAGKTYTSFLHTCRCQCGKCEAMPSRRESICCCEVHEIVQKKQDGDTPVCCITDHEGFQGVCLNVWVD